MVYDISLQELQTFGMTAGHIAKESNNTYTAENYTRAYNNDIGINNALAWCVEQGHNGMRMPKGLTFSFLLGVNSVWSGWTPTILIKWDNFVFDMNGCTFDVIFDSNNKNNYTTYSYYNNSSSYAVCGCLIGVSDCENAVVKNGILRGDVYERSWTNANEKMQEQTYGITVFSFTRNTTITGMDISGFCGDAINAWNSVYNEANSSNRHSRVAITNYKTAAQYNAGRLNDDGTATAYEGCYYTDMISLSTLYAEEVYQNRWYSKKIMLTGSASTKANGNLSSPLVRVLLFNTSVSTTTPTRTMWKKCLSVIDLEEGEDGMKIQYYNEKYKDASAKFGLNVMEYYSDYLIVQGNVIHDNHRGGISQATNNMVIRDNSFYRNGLDCGIGAPLFGSTTRYIIDLENIFTRGLIFDGNYCQDGANGILLNCQNAVISNNKIENFDISSVYVYGLCTFVDVHDNIMKNAPMVGYHGTISIGEEETRKIHVHHNEIHNVDRTWQPADCAQTHLYIENNFIETLGIVVSLENDSSYMLVKDNEIVIHQLYSALSCAVEDSENNKYIYRKHYESTSKNANNGYVTWAARSSKNDTFENLTLRIRNRATEQSFENIKNSDGSTIELTFGVFDAPKTLGAKYTKNLIGGNFKIVRTISNAISGYISLSINAVNSKVLIDAAMTETQKGKTDVFEINLKDCVITNTSRFPAVWNGIIYNFDNCSFEKDVLSVIKSDCMMWQ